MERYSELKNKLNSGKQVDIQSIKETEIDHIENIKINKKLPKEERIITFLNKVKNPYIFKIDNMKVKFEYSENNIGISECLERLIMNKGNF